MASVNSALHASLRGERLAFKAPTSITHPRSTTRPAVLQQHKLCVCQKGFGKSNSKQATSTARNLKRQKPVADDLGPGWFKLTTVEEMEASPKPIKPIILADGSAVIFIKYEAQYFCTDALSTAYKFPLVDSKLIQKKGIPAIEVPLDGTVYELATGKVLDWCPKNTPVRALLGTLKAKEQPERLKTYETAITESGNLYAKLS